MANQPPEGELIHRGTRQPVPRSANQFHADLRAAHQQHKYDERYYCRHGKYPYGERGIGDELIAAGCATVIGKGWDNDNG